MNVPGGQSLRHIEEGYRHRLRQLLARVQPRRLEFGVDLLMRRAREKSEREGLPLPQALGRVYDFTRQRVERRVALMAACAVSPPAAAPARFLCDGSLGGLARWLRAAGYDASSSTRSGESLFPEAQAQGRTLVTTDSRVVRRRAVVRGEASVVWLPSSATRGEHLRMVMNDLSLEPKAPRCMACGGELRPVAKQDVLDRIPPRTRGWKDEYFLCARCGQLFWQGTHWERIRNALRG